MARSVSAAETGASRAPDTPDRVEVGQDGFVVDAAVIAEAFNLDPATVQPLLRSAAMTSISETGVGEDEGRARLTFRYADRTVRFTVDAVDGAILKRSSFTSPAPRDFFGGMPVKP